MRVTKRTGKKEPFDEQKILRCIERACGGNEEHVQRVHYNAKINLYDGVSTKEIDTALIKSARSLIEKDPYYKYVASKLLLGAIYKEVFGEAADSDAFELQYRKTFIINLKKLIKAGILNKE